MSSAGGWAEVSELTDLFLFWVGLRRGRESSASDSGATLLEPENYSGIGLLRQEPRGLSQQRRYP